MKIFFFEYLSMIFDYIFRRKHLKETIQAQLQLIQNQEQTLNKQITLNKRLNSQIEMLMTENQKLEKQLEEIKSVFKYTSV